MNSKLTEPQRRVLQFVAENPGKLRSSCRDLQAFRRDVFDRVWFAGLITQPANTASRTWEITDAGRAALEQGGQS